MPVSKTQDITPEELARLDYKSYCHWVQGLVMPQVMDAIWIRSKTLTRDSMKLAKKIYETRPLSEVYYKWYNKAVKLVQWLDLHENRELWKAERKTLPYERSTAEYHNWRINCLNRDNWQCTECNTSKHLNVHHIKTYKDHKELRLAIDNGVTLCQPCHIQEHRRMRNA